MKEDWDKAIEFVLRMEGGEVAEDVPGDPGGLTKFGISSKAYPSVDIANLTVDQAKGFYRRDYWDACSCDQLPTGFAFAVFDTAVNQGVGKARRLLQAALDINIDGVVGPETLTAAAIATPRRVTKFLALRLDGYARLMCANPALLRFSVNWNFRVLSLNELILQAAA